ncbi:MAG TPA: hypothetical protein VN577_16705 [Terriglobales bacterium]|nr:hypothetical protein [Terriglobales bacterium]
MFNGTMIDDLMNIVKRAEEHARTPETVEAKPQMPQMQMMPGFLYEVANQQVWYGVA